MFFELSKSFCESTKPKKIYLAKNFSTNLRINMNIDTMKQFGYTMNQLLEKIPKIDTKLRFLRGFSRYTEAKSGFEPFLE